MKVMVTGGAGFIGSAVIRHMIGRTSWQVVNVDKLTYAGCLENLREVDGSDRYAFEQEDICDARAMARVLARHRPDAIMNLAAESHVDRSIAGPAAFMATNILGTYTLLEVARRYWEALEGRQRQGFRFHQVSTDEVYGDLPHPDAAPDAYAHQFTETSPYAPSSPYSASKASADHLVRAWWRTYGLPVLISHSGNNYGPYQHPEKLIPLTILNALAGQRLPVYGDGRQIRDWLYVDDHAQALCQVLEGARVGQTYNVGGWNERRNIDVVTAICDVLEEWVPRSAAGGAPGYHGLIQHVQDRPGHDRRYAIDAAKIGRDLGWEPAHTFEDGLRKTVRWYLDHADWCALHRRAGTA